MNNHESPQAQVSQQVSHEEISRRAEELWRQYGSPQGRDEEIWLEAERQLRGIPSNLSSPASEGVEASQSGAVNPASIVHEEKPKPREAELMEQKKSPPAKSRGKSKSGAK